MVVRVLAALIVCLLIAGAGARAQSLSFDPGRAADASPKSAGFTLLSRGLASDGARRTAQGRLRIGPTAEPENLQFWSAPIEIDFARDSFVVEIDVRIVYATGSKSLNFRRGGFSFLVHDAEGRIFDVYLSDDRVFLNKSNAGLTDPSAALDTVSAIRTYRLELRGRIANLYVDNDLLIDNVAIGSTGVSTNRNLFGFGDSTRVASCEAEIGAVRLNIARANR